MERIVITGKGSISSLGCDENVISIKTFSHHSAIIQQNFKNGILPVARLDIVSEEVINSLRNFNSTYKYLDKTVLMAIFASREAFRQAGWSGGEAGVNIGSSRGATETFESRFTEWLGSDKKKTSAHTSPTTTLGNISSWVMQELNMDGPVISHSMTCSTGLQAIANGIAWLKAGMAERFLAGASEAPLTDFTLAQMRALKIYSADSSRYPCRPFELPHPNPPLKGRENRMVLGEGAAVFALEKWKPELEGKILGEILSVGFGNEKLTSPSSISENGECLYKSMSLAIKNLLQPSEIDLIICHAPGTINGDKAELNAIHMLFGVNTPILISNKWKIGHTLGASGVLSLDYALRILEKQDFADFPYPAMVKNIKKPIRTIMINAAGFGGNAVSLIVGKI